MTNSKAGSGLESSRLATECGKKVGAVTPTFFMADAKHRPDLAVLPLIGRSLQITRPVDRYVCNEQMAGCDTCCPCSWSRDHTNIRFWVRLIPHGVH
ncbi:MAG: hypothetical protein HRT77_01465 [Halioglobus sp.]|nr:hypothetical protein [Halioglobus sp.]